MATRAPNPFDKILSAEEEVALQTKLHESITARQLRRKEEERAAVQPLWDFVNSEVYSQFIDGVDNIPRELEAIDEVGDFIRNLRVYVNALESVRKSKPILAPDVEASIITAPIGTDPLQPVAR